MGLSKHALINKTSTIAKFLHLVLFWPWLMLLLIVSYRLTIDFGNILTFISVCRLALMMVRGCDTRHNGVHKIPKKYFADVLVWLFKISKCMKSTSNLLHDKLLSYYRVDYIGRYFDERINLQLSSYIVDHLAGKVQELNNLKGDIIKNLVIDIDVI